MAGIDNLKTPTAEEARRRGKSGGIASGKARREKKAMRETLELLLSMALKDGAVANIEKLLTYTMHIVNNQGVLVAMKANITEELNPDVQQKINRKYTIKKIEQFSLPYENSIRSLVVISNKTK